MFLDTFLDSCKVCACGGQLTVKAGGGSAASDSFCRTRSAMPRYAAAASLPASLLTIGAPASEVSRTRMFSGTCA